MIVYALVMLCAGNCENFPGNILQTTPYFSSLAACENDFPTDLAF